MKRSKDETAKTRKQIVAQAATEFRQNGISARGIGSIMSGVGLTHGGFYRHFESKERLVTEALTQAFSDVLDGLQEGRQEFGVTGLNKLVTRYLSVNKRDNFDQACPLAALGSDLRRADEETRGVASDAIKRLISIVQQQLDTSPTEETYKSATGIVSAMVGGMILARITTDARLSATILANTRNFIVDSKKQKLSEA